MYEAAVENPCNIHKPKPPSLFQQRKALSPLNSFALCRDDNLVPKELSGSRTNPVSKSRNMDKPPKASKAADPPVIAVNHETSSAVVASNRRRSSSTSSVQRLAGTYSVDSINANGSSDDMSVTSVKSINSVRSLRSSSTTRTMTSSSRMDTGANTNAVRGRSRVDDRDRPIRSRSNYSALPLGRSAASSRGKNSAVNSDFSHELDTENMAKRYTTRSTSNPTNSSWLDEQRKIKEDRKLRSRQKPIESTAGEVLINELNRSLLRIQHGGYGAPTSKKDDSTNVETPTKKIAYSSLSNRIASGFCSPFKSPKIATIESPVPHCPLPGKSSETPPRLSKIRLDDSASNILADISGFDPNASQVK